MKKNQSYHNKVRLKFIITLCNIFLCMIITSIYFFYTWGLNKLIDIDHFGYSFSINIVAMGWAAIILHILKPKFNCFWFNTFPIENNGQIYKKLGVLQWKNILKFIGWFKIMNPKIKHNINSIIESEKGTRFGETVHILCIFILIPFIFIMNYKEKQIGIPFLFLNIILFQIYPIMLQRYNRPRYRHLINWKQNIKNTGIKGI